MTDRTKFTSSIGFTDLLFNLLVGFVFLFIVAFILINPPTKRNDIPTKAEFLFVIEWNDDFNDDIDLWVRDPNGTTVSFVRKEGGLLNLEKDDLGYSNDTYTTPDGEVAVLRINREVTTMRGIVPGTYTAFAHVYNRTWPSTRNDDGTWTDTTPPNGQIKFTLVRVNPYREEYVSLHTYTVRKEEIPLIQFTLDEQGNITDIDLPSTSIITGSRVRSNNQPSAAGTPSTRINTTRPRPSLQYAPPQPNGGNGWQEGGF